MQILEHDNHKTVFLSEQLQNSDKKRHKFDVGINGRVHTQSL